MLSLFVLVILVFGPHQWCCVGQEISLAHLTLNRRGGAVARHEAANLTQLLHLLHGVEGRYHRSKREVKGNKLVRKWKARSAGTTNDEQLLSEPGKDGSW